ncbi:DUF4942 domain-containing protein [Candidatus Gracilibacteria bacterium]|nr:DUF4942 domain-containing protein [Candidatus Gracilibacteria bacterium]
MKKQIKDLIVELELNNQSFEWYPTTNEILNCIAEDIKKNRDDNGSFSILDIGAGDCRLNKFLTGKGLKIREYFIIEKSNILIQRALDNGVDLTPFGADFHENSILGFNVEFIFCNPPYLEFEQWTERILKEASSDYIYLVIPQRWKENKAINEIIKLRDYDFKVILNTDFLEADRKARAKVDVIKFFKKENKEYIDPFELWAEETFNIKKEPIEEDLSPYEQKIKEKKAFKKEIEKEIAINKNIVEILIEKYTEEKLKLQNNYINLTNLDKDILKELHFDNNKIIESLKVKISNLKSKYWRELFDRFDKITKRLTQKYRLKILEVLEKRQTIEFNENNIFVVVMWVIKNANKYYNDQLIDEYLDLINPENIRKYKSNFKVFELCKYRKNLFANSKEVSHFYLEYRIINQVYSTWSDSTDQAERKIEDIIVIANNLGFNVNSYFPKFYRGEKVKLYYSNNKVFCEFIYYKNNNLHIKFDTQFMKAWNIEAGRLLGWLKNKSQVVAEMEDITTEDVEKYFNSNKTISLVNNNILMLGE